MTSPNPSITGTAIVDALGPHDGSSERPDSGRAALDEAEIRSTELAELRAQGVDIPERAAPPATRRRSLLDRLLGR
jgi:hypothetical protein